MRTRHLRLLERLRVVPCSLLVMVAAAPACTVPNPSYCDLQTPCPDPAAPHCDLPYHTCRATPPDGGLPDAAPPAGDATVCEAPLRACPDGCYPLDDPAHCGSSCEACQAPSHATATCDGTSCGFTCDGAFFPQGNACHPCNTDDHCGTECVACPATTPVCDGTACVCTPTSCTDDAAPVCDAVNGLCRPCQTHVECPAGACGPDGACVAPADIIYVDGESPTCSDANTGTQAVPLCTVPPAFPLATATRWHVVIAPGIYGHIGTLDLTTGTLALIGAGADSTDLVQAATATPVISVVGTGDLRLFGLTLRGASGANGDGVACAGGASTPHLTITDAVVGPNSGNGILTFRCDVTVDNASITDNDGAGVSASSSTVAVTGATIAGNLGGGLSLATSSFHIVNALIVENGSLNPPPSTVGGVFLSQPQAGSAFVNNTVADNFADGAVPGGVYCFPAATVVNSILWGNTGAQQSGCTVTYSDVQGGAPGTANLDADPLFDNPSVGDYHLPTNSPCVDQGTPTGAPAVDHDGEPRSGAPDLGCFEAP